MTNKSEKKFLTNVQQCIVAPESSIKDGLAAISNSGALLAAIVDKDGQLLGIFTDGDARRAILAGAALTDPLLPHMKANPVVGKANSEPHELRELARAEEIREIPLLDDQGRFADVFVIVTHEERSKVGDTNDTPTDRPVVPNAMFLIAGGKGTRLRSVVSDRPKPLAMVGNKPIIQTIIENAVFAGVRKFFVSVNYKAELIVEHLKLDVYKDLDIQVIHETEFLGTAGSLGYLKERWDNPLVVSNADVLTNIAIDRAIAFHHSTNACATCVVRPYHVQVPFGVVELGPNGVSSIREKPTHKHVVNTGIYVLSPRVQKHVGAGQKLDMPTLLQTLIDAGEKVVPFLMHEYWRDVGRPDEYALANEEYFEIFGNRH